MFVSPFSYWGFGALVGAPLPLVSNQHSNSMNCFWNNHSVSHPMAQSLGEAAASFMVCLEKLVREVLGHEHKHQIGSLRVRTKFGPLKETLSQHFGIRKNCFACGQILNRMLYIGIQQWFTTLLCTPTLKFMQVICPRLGWFVFILEPPGVAEFGHFNHLRLAHYISTIYSLVLANTIYPLSVFLVNISTWQCF